MTRILVICEGQTEMEFVRTVLAPHVAAKGRYLIPTLISTRNGNGRGGNVTVERLANAAQKHYFQADRLTTLVDYYGFKDLAGRPHATLVQDIATAVAGKVATFDPRKFHAYVQMHEFEALLFSSIQQFTAIPDGFDAAALAELKAITEQFAPEDINNSPITAPSKRLAALSNGRYGKVEHGALIAQAIGIDTIRQKCSRFDKWVVHLETW